MYYGELENSQLPAVCFSRCSNKLEDDLPNSNCRNPFFSSSLWRNENENHSLFLILLCEMKCNDLLYVSH